MNSVWKIGLALLLPALAVVVILVANQQSSQLDPRRQEVQAYLHCRSAEFTPTLRVGDYVPARLPQKFQANMSKASFSNTPYYQTTCRFNPEYAGYKPLPYPPNELYCMKVSSADPTAPAAIVIALHQDIYNADWVVHEVTDPATVLPAVGCPFPLP